MTDLDSIDETLPETVKAFLRQGATLQCIRLHATGQWTHEGLAFENPKIIALFNRSVSRTPGGTWVLSVGRFTYPIVVDDTGYFVERVNLKQNPPIIELSDSTTESLVLSTLTYQPTARLYCTIKNGDFLARFKRQAYYDILDRAVERDNKVFLDIGDTSVFIGDVNDLMNES